MSCQSEEYSTENPGPFCINLLADGNPQELKSWLYDGKSVLGELQTNKNLLPLLIPLTQLVRFKYLVSI